MPPRELTPHTPGEPLGTITPLTGDGNAAASEGATAGAQAPIYIAKHNGGGRWKIWHTPEEGEADWFSDFMVAGEGAKALAEAEAQRLLDGGKPLELDPERLNDQAELSQRKASSSGVDASTLKQAVMTPDGWLCPEPPVKE